MIIQFPKPERDRLIESGISIVRTVAVGIMRRLPASFDIDDLIGEGHLGLMAAADTFDPGKGYPFASWARSKITYAILNSARRRNWTANTMEGIYQRQKSREESGSMEDEMRSDVTLRLSSPDAEAIYIDSIDEKRKQSILHDAIAQLRPRKRRVLYMHYQRGQRIATAGRSLRIDASQASRLHHQGLRELSGVLRRRGILVEYPILRAAIASPRAA